MPRQSRSAAAAKKPARPPLADCVVTFCGKFAPWGHTQGSLETLVRTLGGRAVKTVTKDTTHLVCSQQDYSQGNSKVKTAKDADVKIVQPEWLFEAEKQGARVPDDEYLWVNDGTSGKSAIATDEDDEDEEDEDEEDEDEEDDDVKPQRKKQRADGNTNAKEAASVKDEIADKVEKAIKEEKVVAEGQFAKKKGLTIPLDEHCKLFNYHVYVDPDSGMIYDACLNQSNTTQNNNKFYRIQVLRNSTGSFKTWTRWGRVGEVGQNAVLGIGTLQDALKNFERKFKDKTGLSWDQRGEDPKLGKYAFVERNYNIDSDDDEMADADADGTPDVKKVKKEDSDEKPTPECTLPKPVQDLMELIFNQAYFQDTMASMNYDPVKLPLGRLSKATILRGFQQLKDLAAVIDDPTLATSQWDMTLAAATEHLSNRYYSLIPHAFGRNRPPVINTDARLKKEIELLESLSDMKDATDLLKKERSSRNAQEKKVHLLDRHFQTLGMEEMTPLVHNSAEFGHLCKYLNESKGPTHKCDYKVLNIFRIERRGEDARLRESKFATIPSDRRLLWHGSRVTNFGGILSQGLRIAPPEAPPSGYMFGKGIYLADMSSKSAGYCFSSNSNGHALLLLCEAELGDPLYKLTQSNYNAGEDAAKNGMWSTLGQGSTGPSEWQDAGVVHESLGGIRMPDTSVKMGDTKVPGTALLYNEYICYDVAQVKLRYLFHVNF